MGRRHFLIAVLGPAFAVSAAGCLSWGTPAMFDGGAALSSLPLAGGPPRGQTEPEIVTDAEPAAPTRGDRQSRN